MGVTQIRISKDKIKATNAYNNLNSIQKKLIIKRNNVLQIENAINVINNRGYKFWCKNTNYSYNNTKIIDEIISLTAVSH